MGPTNDWFLLWMRYVTQMKQKGCKNNKYPTLTKKKVAKKIVFQMDCKVFDVLGLPKKVCIDVLKCNCFATWENDDMMNAGNYYSLSAFQKKIGYKKQLEFRYFSITNK